MEFGASEHFPIPLGTMQGRGLVKAQGYLVFFARCFSFSMASIPMTIPSQKDRKKLLPYVGLGPSTDGSSRAKCILILCPLKSCGSDSSP